VLGQGLELGPVLAPGQGLEQVPGPVPGLALEPGRVLALEPVLGSQWLTSSRITIMPAELTVFFSSPIYLLKDLKSSTSQLLYPFISTTPLLSKLTNKQKRVW
jgi:hypothetical protein